MNKAMLIRWLVGGSFVWAGVAKLIAPTQFFGALLGYEFPVPEIILRTAAVTLPWLELLCGIALLFDYWPETVRPLASILCGIFVVSLVQALARGLPIECGCFGGRHDAWFNQPLIAASRAVALLVASVFLWRMHRREAALRGSDISLAPRYER